MEFSDDKPQKPSRLLNICCFLLPIALTITAFFIEGAMGVAGFIGSFISACFAGYLLLLNPSRKIRQAAWSDLCGFLIAVIICCLGAVANLSGQASPWMQ